MSACESLLELPQPITVAEGQRARILIIDDDEALTEALAWRLQRQGFDTLTADSGAAGLALAQADCPDLIVLDLRLPDADGFSICAQLADAPQTCTTPVIILSGLEQPDILRRCRAAGCQYFLHKPYDPNALLVLIRHALQQKDEWGS